MYTTVINIKIPLEYCITAVNETPPLNVTSFVDTDKAFVNIVSLFHFKMNLYVSLTEIILPAI